MALNVATIKTAAKALIEAQFETEFGVPSPPSTTTAIKQAVARVIAEVVDEFADAIDTEISGVAASYTIGNNNPAPQTHSWTSTGAAETIASYAPASGEHCLIEWHIVLRRTTGGAAVWAGVRHTTVRMSGASIAFTQQSAHAGAYGDFVPTVTVTTSGATIIVTVTATNTNVIDAVVTAAVTRLT